jgi:hypothetical protein
VAELTAEVVEVPGALVVGNAVAKANDNLGGSVLLSLLVNAV